MTDMAVSPSLEPASSGSQARVEIGSDGTKVFDADGNQMMHLKPPDDFFLDEPVGCQWADEAYISGYAEGFNHGQLGLDPKYREGDTVR
jgi:hypothetical protein